METSLNRAGSFILSEAFLLSEAVLLCRALLVCGALQLAFMGPALAEENYERGLQYFGKRDFVNAQKYFEASIQAAPWDSSSFYYSALTYHHTRNYPKALARYADCIERFPGTPAADNAKKAIDSIDSKFLEKREQLKAAAASSGAMATGGGSTGSSGSTSSSQDKGTIVGPNQTKIYFQRQGTTKVIGPKLNGRPVRAILDQGGEQTTFSKSQLKQAGVDLSRVSGSEVRIDLALGDITRKNFPVRIDDSLSEGRVGHSFLDAFQLSIDDRANSLTVSRAAGGAATAGGTVDVPFSKEGKDVIVNVDVNGRTLPMVFDTDNDAIVFSAQAARSAGLKPDEGEEISKSAADGPQRGDPNWVPPTENPSGSPKRLTLRRVKLGPVDKSNVSATVIEQSTGKYPRLGESFFGSYNFKIDYPSKVIHFTRR